MTARFLFSVFSVFSSGEQPSGLRCEYDLTVAPVVAP